nr:isoprenyl transferase [Kocuria palustris]
MEGDRVPRTRPLYRLYEQRLAAELPPERLPGHVGVLVDGNRRWAVQSGGSTADGHRAGAEKIIEFLGWCRDLRIPHVTLYVLSTENLKRPAEELGPLLEIIAELMRSLSVQSPGQVQAVGALEMLPPELRESIRELEQATSGNDGPHLNIAVGYGGRQEIVDAVREIFTGALERGEDIPRLVRELSVEDISQHLYTRGQPDPDLLIRTSGEQRLSGFLMWQSAYSEYHFCEALWPDFRYVDFLRALRDYANRKRRFGG